MAQTACVTFCEINQASALSFFLQIGPILARNFFLFLSKFVGFVVQLFHCLSPAGIDVKQGTRFDVVVSTTELVPSANDDSG